MTEADFRAAYPEFSNIVTYPSATVTGLLATALIRLEADL